MNAAIFRILIFLALATPELLYGFDEKLSRHTVTDEAQTSKGSVQIHQSSDARAAQAHYRVALVALKNNDLPAAEEELQKAANLAPKNALILYNLAVVQSKRDEPDQAMANLKSATQLGIPTSSKGAADDLLAELTYKLKKKEEKQQAASQKQTRLTRMAWLSRPMNWKAERERVITETGCSRAKATDYDSATLSLSVDEDREALFGTMYTAYVNSWPRENCSLEQKITNKEYKITVAPSSTDRNRILMSLQFVSCSGDCKAEDQANSVHEVLKTEKGFRLTGWDSGNKLPIDFE